MCPLEYFCSLIQLNILGGNFLEYLSYGFSNQLSRLCACFIDCKQPGGLFTILCFSKFTSWMFVCWICGHTVCCIEIGRSKAPLSWDRHTVCFTDCSLLCVCVQVQRRQHYDWWGLWLFDQAPGSGGLWSGKDYLPLPLHRQQIQPQIHHYSGDRLQGKKSGKLILFSLSLSPPSHLFLSLLVNLSFQSLNVLYLHTFSILHSHWQAFWAVELPHCALQDKEWR